MIVYEKIREMNINELTMYVADFLASYFECIGVELPPEDYESLMIDVYDFLCSEYEEPYKYMS